MQTVAQRRPLPRATTVPPNNGDRTAMLSDAGGTAQEAVGNKFAATAEGVDNEIAMVVDDGVAAITAAVVAAADADNCNATSR